MGNSLGVVGGELYSSRPRVDPYCVSEACTSPGTMCEFDCAYLTPQECTSCKNSCLNKKCNDYSVNCDSYKCGGGQTVKNCCSYAYGYGY